MSGRSQRIIRPRVIVYVLVVAGLLSLFTYLIATKSPLDVTVLRSLGRPFVIGDGGEVQNTMRVKLANRTDKSMRVRFGAAPGADDVRVAASQEWVELAPAQSWTEPVLVTAPPESFPLGTRDIVLRITTEDGTTIDRKCRLLGPSSALGQKGRGNAGR